MNTSFIKHISAIQSGNKPEAVMVVVVTTSDSTPQSPGARMLVSPDRSILGTIGGGTIEKMAVDHAIKMLKNNTATDFKGYDMDPEAKSDNTSTGMLCGGAMSLYFERIASEERLLVYGCGHIGGILAPMAANCGFHVIAVDHRAELMSAERFGDSVEIHCCEPQIHASDLDILPGDFIVIMTHNHQFDEDVLQALLKKVTNTTMPTYIGMIGSSKKVKVILANINRAGVSQDILDSVHTPIGLKTGGGSPGEIAISIMAEILAVKYKTITDGTVRAMKNQ